MKKIIISLLSFSMSFCMFLSNSLPVYAEEQETELIELITIDLQDTVDREYKVVLPSGNTATVLVENLPIITTRGQTSSLSGSFNKRFTFTEGSPFYTMSAIYSGNVTSSSVSLNRPSNGQFSGAINVDTGSYSYYVETRSSTDKTAIFSSHYSFPVVGTTHVMELRLNVTAGSSNNAVLYTNGVF